MDLGGKILAVAKQRGMGLKTLSSEAGLPYNTLRGYTRPGSRRLPSAAKGVVLAKALDVPTDWLFDDSQGLPAPPRLDPPPFIIRPWPPNLISWGDLQTALAGYLLDRYIASLNRQRELLGEENPHTEMDLHELAKRFHGGGGATDAVLEELAAVFRDPNPQTVEARALLRKRAERLLWDFIEFCTASGMWKI